MQNYITKEYTLSSVANESVWMSSQLNDSIKDEIIANQRMIPPGKSLMALNGALIDIEDIDLYL